MVVGVLTTSYPRFAGDHAGCFVEDQVNALLARGDRVEVFAAAADVADVAGGAAGQAEITRGGALTVWRVPVLPAVTPRLFYGEGAPEVIERRGLFSWSTGLQGVSFWGGLCARLHQRRAGLDRLISHWLLPCAAAALAVAPALPLRTYAHSGDVALLERVPGGRALARWMATRPSLELVFVSAALRRRFAALAGRDVGTVETLTVPGDLFHPATRAAREEARRRLGLTRPTVVAVGRLVPIKGFDVLLSACARITAAVDLVIIGDGPEHESLQAQARAMGVPLRLPGFLPRPQLADWLQAADVYAQPSVDLPSRRTEGLPVSTLEAMAVGLPIVASRAGGLPELAAHSNQITLVPPGDARALAGALSPHCRAAQRSFPL